MFSSNRQGTVPYPAHQHCQQSDPGTCQGFASSSTYLDWRLMPAYTDRESCWRRRQRWWGCATCCRRWGTR